ncbi:MAG: hypothetical protein LBG87_01735, partial [Spirochaetaceae bacterium]|nr:hypothetical protein [Spirochaetaceae bacterium]
QTHLNCIKIENNIYLSFTGVGHNHGFFALASKYIPDVGMMGAGQFLPLYILDETGKRACNVRDSAVSAFRARYKNGAITKEDIFHYIYGVFHYPAYRETYRHDLRRSRPRVPFYEDFFRFANAGKRLMELHVNFETAEEYPLEVSGLAEDFALSPDSERRKVLPVKRQFKFDKTGLRILLDELTVSGIPAEALEYRLGIRSAIEWLADQYKIRPQDEVTAQLSGYDYADYKTAILSLAGKIVTVSLETRKVIAGLCG